MSQAARAAVVVTGTLAFTGVLASVALGDSCPEAVRWNDVIYVGQGGRYPVPERTRRLGEEEVEDCIGGRCAPPEAKTALFALEGVAPEIAIAAPAVDAETQFFLAPGTFPALPDHPLHEAIYGSPTKPNYRQQCGESFRFAGEITQVDFLRIRVDEPVPEQLEKDDDQVWLELDVESRVDGFDRNGVATISEGEEVVVTARLCKVAGEPAAVLVDLLRPG
jgi:hypothetical protein